MPLHPVTPDDAGGVFAVDWLLAVSCYPLAYSVLSVVAGFLMYRITARVTVLGNVIVRPSALHLATPACVLAAVGVESVAPLSDTR